MDPPWAERGSGRIKRGAQRHYRVMGKTRIRDAILHSGCWRPSTNSHLYLWVTNNKLPDGLWLMGELGFRYVTNVAWHKPRYGIGQYFRGQHELMLFGVRGDGYACRTVRKDLPSSICADHVRNEKNQRVHSAKPPEFYRLIEARSVGPRVEFFARGKARRGWTVWGDQANVDLALLRAA